jgi:hypothetical protein
MHVTRASAPTKELKGLVLLVASLLATAGCDVAMGHLNARATDEWVHSYPLAAGGEVQIGNTNGRIEIEGVEGSTLEVRAERTVRAATEEAAREMLPRVTINEDVSPNKVSIDTDRLAGILVGASVEVSYHAKVPIWALVRVRTTNGEIAVEKIAGRVVATTTNGGVTAHDMSGGVEARATNGRLEIAIRALGNDPIDLRTTNGSVQLTLPQSAKANVSATCTNGSIDLSGAALDLMGEQSKRHARGRLNGGGTPVDLTTTNGKIVVSVQ